LPGKCPDEAACVGFYSKLSNACTNALPEQRFERSFCMKKCTSDSDCRESEGYRCSPPPAEVNAVVLEEGDAATTSVCMAELKLPKSSAASTEPAICSASDASFPDVSPPTADATPDATSRDARSADAGKSDATSRDAAEGGAVPDVGVRDARSER
jgi:hypothetical protein